MNQTIGSPSVSLWFDAGGVHLQAGQDSFPNAFVPFIDRCLVESSYSRQPLRLVAVHLRPACAELAISSSSSAFLFWLLPDYFDIVHSLSESTLVYFMVSLSRSAFYHPSTLFHRERSAVSFS